MADNVIQDLSQSTTTATHLQRDVSSLMSKYLPDRHPLDTLTRQAEMMSKAIAAKVEWEAIKTMNRKATVTALSTAAANATTAGVLTVDSTAAFAPDDVLSAVKVLNGAKYFDTSLPQFLVKAINSGTELTVYSFSTTAENAYVLTPAIPADTVLTWIGTARGEFAGLGKSKIIVSGNEYNYCQFMDANVRVSKYRQATQNYTSVHDWATARQEGLSEFRKTIELTKWFSKRAIVKDSTIDATDGQRYKMSGVLDYITRNIDYDPASLDELVMLDWLGEVFNGNNGSETRFLFADSKLVTGIQKAMVKNKRHMESVAVAGMRCTRIEFTEGVLILKKAQLFTEAGMENFGVILDMAQIGQKNLIPMEVDKIDQKKMGTANADVEHYTETSTLVVKNPDCHAILRGRTAAQS